MTKLKTPGNLKFRAVVNETAIGEAPRHCGHWHRELNRAMDCMLRLERREQRYGSVYGLDGDGRLSMLSATDSDGRTAWHTMQPEWTVTPHIRRALEI